MAQQYTENSSQVKFNDIDWSVVTLANGKVVRGGQGPGNENSTLNPTDRNGDPITRTDYAIDAINIDWNGAEVGTVNGIDFGTIKTTGKLLKEIIQQNSPMFARVA